MLTNLSKSISEKESLSLHSDGGIIIHREDNQVLSISQPEIITGISIWENREIDIDIFSRKRAPWEVSYKGDGIDFTGEVTNRLFSIDNHNNEDGNNIFVISPPTPFEFDRSNKYHISFQVSSSTRDQSTVSAMLSPYILFHDETGGEIYREKFYCNLSLSGEWEEISFNFIPPMGATNISMGLFLNSHYKLKLKLKSACICEYLFKAMDPFKDAKWKIKESDLESHFEWKSSNQNISVNIRLRHSHQSSQISLEHSYKFKKKTAVDTLFWCIKSDDTVTNLLHRDLSWKSPEGDKVVIDRWTPKYFTFGETIGVTYANGFDSIIVEQEEGTVVRFNVVNVDDTPNFHFVDAGVMEHDLEQLVPRGLELNTFVVIDINTTDSPIFSSRNKGATDAVFVMTHHADATINETFEAVMQGTSDRNSPDYGKNGLIGRDLKVTWSVFSKSIRSVVSNWTILRKSDGTSIDVTENEDGTDDTIVINTLDSNGDVHNVINSVPYNVGPPPEENLTVEFSVSPVELPDTNVSCAVLVDLIDNIGEQIERKRLEIILDPNKPQHILHDFDLTRATSIVQILFFINKDIRVHFEISNLKLAIGDTPLLPTYIGEGKKKVDYSVEGLDSERFVDSLRRCGSNNAEFILHTATNYADDREAVDAAIVEISEFNARNWIDHSLSSGIPSSGLKSQGWNPKSEFYVMDIFHNNGYEYAWSYIDNVLDGINQLQPSKYDNHTPILFQHHALKAGGVPIWQWSTFRPPIKTFFDHVNEQNLQRLVEERGISVLHEYFSHATRQNDYMFRRMEDGSFVITEKLDSLFCEILKWVSDGYIWNPTFVEFADYIRSIDNVQIIAVKDGFEIINNGEPIQEYCLWRYTEKLGPSLGLGDLEVAPTRDYLDEYDKYKFHLPSGGTRIKFLY